MLVNLGDWRVTLKREERNKKEGELRRTEETLEKRSSFQDTKKIEIETRFKLKL